MPIALVVNCVRLLLCIYQQMIFTSSHFRAPSLGYLAAALFFSLSLLCSEQTDAIRPAARSVRYDCLFRIHPVCVHAPTETRTAYCFNALFKSGCSPFTGCRRATTARSAPGLASEPNCAAVSFYFFSAVCAVCVHNANDGVNVRIRE